MKVRIKGPEEGVMEWSDNVMPQQLFESEAEKEVPKFSIVVERKEESALMFEAYKNSPHWKFNQIPTTRVTVIKEYKDGKKYKVKLDIEHSILHPSIYLQHNWSLEGEYTTLIFSWDWNWLNKEWTFNQSCYWLVTDDGHDVPILSPHYGVWQDLPDFIILWDEAQRCSVNTEGFVIVKSMEWRSQKPVVVELSYNGFKIADTVSIYEMRLHHLFDIFLDRATANAQLLRTLYMARIIPLLRDNEGHLKDSMRIGQENYGLLDEKYSKQKKWVLDFFEEAIPKLEKTKTVSRNKVFGQLRKWLEDKYQEFALNL